MRPRIAGIICALVLVLALPGCSAIKLGYNALPDLTYWWLDAYVDFDDTQAPQVRAALADLHAWHRQEQLPQLADMLGRLEQVAGGAIAPEQACAFIAEVRDRIAQAAERAEPAAVELVGSLSDRQLRHLERKLRSNNDKFRKDWIVLPPAEARDKRFARAVERAEMFYGKLDAPQQAMLRQGMDRSIFDASRLLAERQRRQQDLLATLRQLQGAAPSGDIRAAIRGLRERSLQSPDLAFRRWQEALVQESCRTFAALHERTTASQREKAVRRLRAYQRDLRELAERRGQPDGG